MAVKYKIRYLAAFYNELDEIKEYLSKYSQATVEKFKTALTCRLELLKDNPELYAVYPGDTAFRRMVISRDYSLYYMVNEDDKVIEVFHVLSNSKNLNEIFNSGKYIHENRDNYDE